MADVKSRLLKEILREELQLWERFKGPQLPTGRLLWVLPDCWFSWTQAQRGRTASGGQQAFLLSSLGGWCLATPPGSLLFAWASAVTPSTHRCTALSFSQCTASLPSFFPRTETLSKEQLPTSPAFLCLSLQWSAPRNLDSIFFKCCINKISECAPSASSPSCNNDKNLFCFSLQFSLWEYSSPCKHK